MCTPSAQRMARLITSSVYSGVELPSLLWAEAYTSTMMGTKGPRMVFSVETSVSVDRGVERWDK